MPSGAGSGPFRFFSDVLVSALVCPALGVLWSAWVWLFQAGDLARLPILGLPLSPSTSLAFCALLAAFPLARREPRTVRARYLIASASGLVFLLALLVGLSHLMGVDFLLERWLVVDPTPIYDTVRQEMKLVGRMSPITAAILLALAPIPPLLGRYRQAAAILGMLVLFGGLILLLGFAMGTPLIHWDGVSPSAFLSGLSFIPFGIAAISLAGPGVFPLSILVAGGRKGPSIHRLRFPPGVLLAFSGVAMLVIVAATVFLRVQRHAVLRSARLELATVADLKGQQISQWYLERRADLQVLAGSPAMRSILAGGRAPDPLMSRWIALVRDKYAYHSVAVFDAQGRLRIDYPGGASGLGKAHPLPAGLSSGEVLVEDFHREAGDEAQVHMVLWAPVLDPESGSKVIGAVRLLIDHTRHLGPMLRTWPSPSPTAEILLGRREGDEAVNLSLSRHRPEQLLRRRFRIDGNLQLPGAQAAHGRTGEMEGRDYRGVPVMATLRRVDGTPWFMVAKVDQSEVLQPLRAWGWMTLFVAVILLGMTALGVSLQLRRVELRSATRRLELERSAKTMAERFHHLMREANDIILLADRDRMVLEASLVAEEIYGVPPGGLEGIRLEALLAPGEGSAFEEGMEILELTGSARFETRHRGKGGRTFPVSLSVRLVEIDGMSFMLVLGRDVTERKAHECEIERLGFLYASLSCINQAIVHLDSRDAIFLEVCRALVESGRFQMAWVGWLEGCELHPVAECGDGGGYVRHIRIRSDDTPEGRGPTGIALRSGIPYICNDIFTDPATGPWRDLMLRQGFSSSAAFPIHIKGLVQGSLAVYAREAGVFGSKETALLSEAARDIAFAVEHLEEVASRSRAEEELRVQAERLRLAAASAGLGVWEIDLEGGQGYYDERLGEIYGEMGAREFPIEEWDRRIHPEERERVKSLIQAAFQSGSNFSISYRILRQDGQVRVIRGDGLFVKDAEGRIVRCIGTNRDMTDELRQEEERRNLQIQLHQAQKMESLGILAGGVAHDMNNVMGAILTRASAEREGMDPASSTARSLDVIINACMRGRGVVKSLLCFARQDLEERCPVDLNVMAREMVQLLAYTTLKRVAFTLDLQEPLARIQGDPGALSHAVMNLCVNAVDAMPRGGTLAMSTRLLAGGWVELCVRDTGEGMSPEIMEKAVEPFFTTKPMGKGTGLGLSMVFGTMKAHGGDMEIDSTPGQGTEIRLRFPADPNPAMCPESPAEGAPEDRAATVSRSLDILVVDDDELIRESVGPMLELLGHRPVLSSGGLEALEMLKGGLDPDLVILDMNMPGINGAETLARVLDLRPGQAVLMSSGYSPEDIHGLLKGHDRVSSIQKPFTMRELEAKLATAVKD